MAVTKGTGKQEKPTNPRPEYMLFAPKSDRGLRFDYPELAAVPQFKNLRKGEFLFVWCYACKSSPYYDLNLPEQEIIRMCIEHAELNLSDGVKRANFMSGMFPDNIKEAIPIMNSYEPNIRMLLKIEAAKDILDIKKLTSLELDDQGNHMQFYNKDSEVDFTKKKHYMAMIEKKDEMLPKLMAKSELGLIQTKESKTDNKALSASGKTYATEYHETN